MKLGNQFVLEMYYSHMSFCRKGWGIGGLSKKLNRQKVSRKSFMLFLYSSAGWEVWLKQKVQSKYSFRYFEGKGINLRRSYKEGYAAVTC